MTTAELSPSLTQLVAQAAQKIAEERAAEQRSADIAKSLEESNKLSEFHQRLMTDWPAYVVQALQGTVKMCSWREPNYGGSSYEHSAPGYAFQFETFELFLVRDRGCFSEWGYVLHYPNHGDESKRIDKPEADALYRTLAEIQDRLKQYRSYLDQNNRVESAEVEHVPVPGPWVVQTGVYGQKLQDELNKLSAKDAIISWVFEEHAEPGYNAPFTVIANIPNRKR
jgi:hypothetical protein